MIAYAYNRENGYYIGVVHCQLDPLETEINGTDTWFLPADATYIQPPIQYDAEYEIPIWTGSSWVLSTINNEPESANGNEEFFVQSFATFDELSDAIKNGINSI